MLQRLTWDTKMNAPTLSTQEEYELATRELSAMFDAPPAPGSPDAARFELLLRLVDEYESKQMSA
jgi:HTH-type transcriptional regulator/antitoxin HigA